MALVLGRRGVLMADIFFNARKLPNPKNEYVLFIDIMGTQTHMNHSVKETANFIFKLHSAIISSWREKAYKNVFVYPVMDGAYITAGTKEDIENIIVRIYRGLAKNFLKEELKQYLYMIRGGLAYGEIIHGHNVPYNASKAFEMSLGYKDNILLGNAMIYAYKSEGLASPFGIFVHESAIKQANKRFGAFSSNWKWFESETLKMGDIDIKMLLDKTMGYLSSMKDPTHPLHYDTKKIDNHIKLVKNYFDT